MHHRPGVRRSPSRGQQISSCFFFLSIPRQGLEDLNDCDPLLVVGRVQVSVHVMSFIIQKRKRKAVVLFWVCSGQKGRPTAVHRSISYRADLLISGDTAAKEDPDAFFQVSALRSSLVSNHTC